eukprot:TRINITY_DN13092_c0_g1_i1.p1 TRINITY_DN13092_c0_g1~~TRINITY_DN13092_c0_g1_i1.p1  ORF type:complete len:961 (+),score=234.20 TRINITY_DN13092_c0_g1_i1:88-2883(+)
MAMLRVDYDADGNAEISPPKPRKVKPLLDDEEEEKSPKKPAIKSALKGGRPQPRAEETPTPPTATSPTATTPMKPSPPPALKSAIKSSTVSDLEPSPPKAPKPALKGALKRTTTNDMDPKPPGSAPPVQQSPKVKSAMKSRPPPKSEEAEAEDLVPPMTPKRSDGAPHKLSTSLLDPAALARNQRSRPSVFKMTLDLPDETSWSTRGICRHYYYFACQKMLWETANEASKPRKSVKLEDLASRMSITGSLRREHAFTIEEPEEPQQPTAAVGEVSPLKELMLMKKPCVDDIRKLLESLTDREKWINAPLDSTPPAMPSPMFQAVAAVQMDIVGLLMEFGADTMATYQGSSMLKGWIKPNTDLVQCVQGRKARFVGTMLGDKLEAIEGLLMEARDRAKQLEEDKVKNEKEQSEPIRSELRTNSTASSASRMLSKNACERRSVQMKCSTGFVMHTQGHPNQRYELDGEFSGTSQSSIRVATDMQTGNVVAIKAGYKHYEATGKNKDHEAELWNEIAIMRKIDHPNVTKLVETLEDELHIYMVFDMCAGGVLFDRLAREGALEARSCSRVAYQMGSAIRHLHGLRVCHRDIQPESFLIAADLPLEETCVKLVDFDTAKDIGPSPLMTKVCTLHYVAPEILTSERGYDEKVDIWSLGVTIYVMCSGVLPFDGDFELDVLKAIKKGDFKLPTRPEVSDELKELLSKMLVVDPSQRLDCWGTMEHAYMVDAETHGAVIANSDESGKNNTTEEENGHKLIRIAFDTMAEMLNDDQLQSLRNLLRELDFSESGLIDFVEAREPLCRLLSEELEEGSAARELIAQLQTQEMVGKINYLMILATMTDKRRCMRREAARTIFNVFDIDKNGNVSPYEIVQALRKSDDLNALRPGATKAMMAIWEEMKDVFNEEKAALGTGRDMPFEEFFRQLPKAGRDVAIW